MRKKKLLSCLLSLVMLASSAAGGVCSVSAASDELPSRIMNSSFENPAMTRVTWQVNANQVEYWNTTAYGNLIELLRSNRNIYIPGKLLEPRAGLQAAELNADEQSSLYQDIKTTPGSFVKWGISHHGRAGYDTMLLVIGPKQAADPAKPSKNGYDQFMKIGQFIRNNAELSSYIPSGNGCSREFVVYSPKFAAKGSFVTGDNATFTLKKTAVNTEEWHIWFIKSNNDNWYDYGTNASTNSAELPYNNIYEVPEGQEETTFAFTAYECAGSLTVGNIIDNIDFGVLYNLTLNALDGGSGTARDSAESTASLSVSETESASNKYKDGSTVTVTAIPNTDADYGFAGALINGKACGYKDFTAQRGGGYTKDISIDESKLVQLIFSRNGHIIYDPNGGSFKGSTGRSDMEFSYYTNGKQETEVPTIADAAFTGWTMFTKEDGNTGIVIPANHEVEYDASNSSKPTLTIKYTNGGVDKSVTIPATSDSGVVFVADYNYAQNVSVMTADSDGNYKFDTDGGTVSINNETRVATVSESVYTKTTSGVVGDTVSVKAEANPGYVFDGWFENEDDSEPVSKSAEYSYVVTGVSAIYAKFSPQPEPEVVIPPYDIPDLDNDYAYIFGYSDNEMGPDGNLLRGEASAMIHRLMKQNGKLGNFSYDASAEPRFEDTRGKWFRSAIEYMVSRGAFANAGENVYAKNPIKRGELFKLICLGLGYTDDNTLTINDYANILHDAGVIEGYEDGSLGIDNYITRAEFCTMYNRIIGRDNASIVTADGGTISGETYGFVDLDPSEWYYEDMLRATSAYDGGYVSLDKRGIRNNLDDFEYNTEI